MPLPPDTIAIDHDDYHARYVGHTSDGHQFFLTTPFVPAIDEHTVSREFVALFLFDADGTLVKACIDDFGSREDLDERHAQQVIDQRLGELGDIEYARITVRPFQIVRFDTTFGLITHAPDGNDDWWWVSFEPGDYMAFHEPWDSGSYDT